MKNRRELLKLLPFLAAAPFVRIPNIQPLTYIERLERWRSHHKSIPKPWSGRYLAEYKTLSDGAALEMMLGAPIPQSIIEFNRTDPWNKNPKYGAVLRTRVLEDGTLQQI